MLSSGERKEEREATAARGRREEGGRGSSRFERAARSALADPEKTEDTVELFIKKGRGKVGKGIGEGRVEEWEWSGGHTPKEGDEDEC